MYLNVYFDYSKQKVYHKYIDRDGRRKSEMVPFEFDYYVRDKTHQSNIKTIFGESVVKKTARNLEAYKNLNKNLVYETNISFETKFLNKIYGNKKLEPDISKFRIGIIDIETEKSAEFPDAELAKYPINLISVYLSSHDKVFTFGTQEYTGDEVSNFHYCENESLLLQKFVKFFRKAKLDIVTGWNSNNFDIPYIINRCKKLDVDYTKLSPLNKVNFNRGEYYIAGVYTIDYMKLYKKYWPENQERYSLEYTSQLQLGEGKKTNYKNWNEFVEYNIQDVILIKKLDEKLKFFALLLNVAYNSLIPLNKVFSELYIHVGLFTKILHHKNLVMPQTNDNEKEEYPGGYVMAKKDKFKYIMSYDAESEYPSMIRQFNIGLETLVKDPSEDEINDLIKTPLSEYKDWTLPSGHVKRIGGIYYKKDRKSVLSEITEMLFQEKKACKLKGKICREKTDSINELSEKLDISEEKVIELQEQIINESGNGDYYVMEEKVRKVLVNSLYGVVANIYFPFYNILCATTITLGGQTLIKYLANNTNKYLKNHFYKNKKYFKTVDEKNKLKEDVIVLIDTDSIYIKFDELLSKLGHKFDNRNDFWKWANKFDKEVLSKFFRKILDIQAKKYNADSIINFEREKIASQMIVTAKKRYLMEVLDDGKHTYLNKPKIFKKGVEIVRKSTPKFCRDKLLESVEYLFDQLWIDKENARTNTINYLKGVKKSFKKQNNVCDIAFPRSVSDYKKYDSKQKIIPKGCPIHVRGSIIYNKIIEDLRLSLEKINNGAKIYFIYVKKMKNKFNTHVISWIGDYPGQYNDIFVIDYEKQWQISFQSVFEKLFDSINYGKINLNSGKLNSFLK